MNTEFAGSRVGKRVPNPGGFLQGERFPILDCARRAAAECPARSTIAKTLKEHGISPSRGRATSWRTFLRAHADAIAAADFFTAEVWTARGLVTHYVLFVIAHATRAVELAGITTNPDSAFVAQIARNLTDSVDGFLRGKRFLTLERAVRDYVEHYNTERPHQGLGNELINGRPSTSAGEVAETERLGGLLRSYHRAA
jgi:transposase InsO family protein